MTTFKEMGLNHDILESLKKLEFINPSPIQEQSIPFILNSKQDLIALAQTGTGKTAAFSLPILNQIKSTKKDLQAIILCPTRELCLQITEDIRKFAERSKGLSVTAVYGGAKIEVQMNALRKGTNIVVGTPGRVHDLIRRKVLKLQKIQWLVLDEADEMLDMGFKDDLDAILSETPENRQTLLFSATMSKSVASIAKQYMKDAHEISMGEKNTGAKNVSHEYYMVNARDRFEALQRILDGIPGVYGILFCRTRRETQVVADNLKAAHYDTEALHGDISQGMRTKIMGQFKKKQIRLLVATDVAARGIDVNDLSHVINYNMPDQNASYTHRSGRTGRAQKSGVSISIITPKEKRRIKELEKIIGKDFEMKKIPDGQEICRKQIENYLLEVAEVDINHVDAKYFDEYIQRLKKITKEDLIKHFITQKLNHIISNYKNTRDLNAKEKNFTDKKSDSKNNESIKINIGKNQRLDIKGVFSLINSHRRLKGIEVGKIDIMSDYSIITLEKRRANDVIKFLNNRNYKGKKMSVTKAGGSIGTKSSGGRNRRTDRKNRNRGPRKKRS